MANTTKQELILILQTLVGPNNPNSDINNYYDQVTMQPTAPTTDPDRVMQIVTETILFERNPASYGYNLELDSGAKTELYADIVADLGTIITTITAIKTAIDAAG